MRIWLRKCLRLAMKEAVWSRSVLTARPRFNPQTLSNILITSFIYSKKNLHNPIAVRFKESSRIMCESNFNYSTLSGGC